MRSTRTLPSTSQSGAALLTALVIVAALASLAALMMETMRRTQRLDANLSSQMQAQWLARGADAYARSSAQRLERSGELTALLAAGPLQAAFPLDQGLMRISAVDGGSCINLNSVVSGAGDIYAINPTGSAQVRELMTGLGISSVQAEELVAALGAWMDTASSSSAVTGDDIAYRQSAGRYLTGGEPLSELSELRAIRGVTPEIYALLRPYICTLPVTGPSPLSINTLSPDQARILSAALLGRLSEGAAEEVLRSRPAEGWKSLGEFFAHRELRSMELPQEAMEALSLKTRFIELTAEITHLDADIVMSEILDLRDGAARPIARRWSDAP